MGVQHRMIAYLNRSKRGLHGQWICAVFTFVHLTVLLAGTDWCTSGHSIEPLYFNSKRV